MPHNSKAIHHSRAIHRNNKGIRLNRAMHRRVMRNNSRDIRPSRDTRRGNNMEEHLNTAVSNTLTLKVAVLVDLVTSNLACNMHRPER
jgi:flagellar basal body L-ring protein FlgH